MSDSIKLGELVKDDAQGRDAIHIAIVPVIAGERLSPGQHIGLMAGRIDTVRAGETRLGIVDPFLNDWIEEGQRFYMLMYPQTITSLRHDWTHPAFPSALPVNEQAYDKTPEQQASEDWLRSFALVVGVSYATLISAAVNYVARGEYHTLDYDTPQIVYDEAAEMWHHIRIVTRMEVADKTATFFSCAC